MKALEPLPSSTCGFIITRGLSLLAKMWTQLQMLLKTKASISQDSMQKPQHTYPPINGETRRWKVEVA